MRALYETLKACHDCGLPRVLRIRSDIMGEALAVDQNVSQWLNDARSDRELRRIFRNIFAKAPYIDSLLSAAQRARPEDRLEDVSWEGESQPDLTLAYLLAAPLVSFPGEPWAVDPLPVHVDALTGDEVRSFPAELPNFYAVHQVLGRRAWIQEQMAEALSSASGKDLLHYAQERLKYLEFCEHARDQLAALTGNERQFKFVVRHMFALNERGRTWIEGECKDPFNKDYRFNCSDESQATLDQFGHLRMFGCPDGQTRLFSWHSKIALDAWRIHFFAWPQQRRVLIGYIGPHLRIVSG